MWPTVIILLVIAMVVGPVMMLRPSKRDQYLAQLRAKARERNLSVSASRFKDASGSPCWFYWHALEVNDNDKAPVHAPFLLERKPYAHDLHVADFFELAKGQHLPKGVEPIIKALPESVQAVELNRHAVGVHWNERGGEAVLDTIAEQVAQLLPLLRG